MRFSEIPPATEAPAPKYFPKTLSEERIEQMKAHAVELRRKHPWMKPDRVKRKVAEYFKIKLV